MDRLKEPVWAQGPQAYKSCLRVNDTQSSKNLAYCTNSVLKQHLQVHTLT